MVGFVCYRIMNLFNAYPVVGKKIAHRDIGLSLAIFYPSGYFDGAAISNIGGAGFILHISLGHYFHVNMGCNNNTNTREELLAL